MNIFLSINAGRRGMNKIFVIIGTILVLLASLGVVLVSMGIITLPQLTRQEVPLVAVPTQSPVTTLTGLEIAKKTALFLDKATQQDGSVISVFTCYLDTCTPPPPNFNRSSGYAGVAYYALFKATGDSSYQTKAQNVLDFALSECQKDKQICIGNFSPFYLYYTQSNDTRYKDILISVADEFPANKTAPEYAFNWGVYGAKLAAL